MANKKRLIDANALKIAFKCREMADIDMYGGVHIAECFQGHEANEIVDKMQTVDAVEVVHGRWDAVFEYEDFQYAYCSACGERSEYMTKYCPNCGAKMDGERKDNDT